jgi:energy-coupling factor transporter transmembrane protein EcfT
LCFFLRITVTMAIAIIVTATTSPQKIYYLSGSMGVHALPVLQGV